MPGNGHIFICHAPEDAARCAPLLAALQAWGADYWYVDSATTDAASELTSAQRQAITDRDIFIRICTPAAQRSAPVAHATAAFRAAIMVDHEQGREQRTLINLIRDPAYIREPFDHATIFIDATITDALWQAELRRALRTRGNRTALPIIKAPDSSQ